MSDFDPKAVRDWLDKNPTATSVNVNAIVAALNEIDRLSAPRVLLLWCPSCRERHIDEGEFATKPHHTHACQHCGHVWRPAIEPTVGVRFLPGFKNDAPAPAAKRVCQFCGRGIGPGHTMCGPCSDVP